MEANWKSFRQRLITLYRIKAYLFAGIVLAFSFKIINKTHTFPLFADTVHYRIGFLRNNW